MSMNWFEDLPNTILKKCKFTEMIDVNLYRAPSKSDAISYQVKYIMEQSNSPDIRGHKKYAMFIKFISKEGNDGKYAIIIGQNPSLSQTIKGLRFHVDDTNWNQIKIFSNLGYEGIIMLNTFATIDPAGKYAIPKGNQNNNIDVSKLILSSGLKSDIFIACSTSNKLSSEYVSKIIGFDFTTGKVNSQNTYKMITMNKKIVTHFSTQSLREWGDKAIEGEKVDLTFEQIKGRNYCILKKYELLK